MASATLTAKLVGDAKGMVDAFDKGEKAAGKFGDNAAGASKKIALLGGAMAAAAGVAALAAAKNFADVGSEIYDMSQRTGIGAQALTELKFAAEQSGTSLAGVEVGVGKMQKSIVAASQGSKEMAEKFGALGISLDDLKGRTPERQFDLVSQAIAGLKDPTERAGAAMQVFGKSGTALLPLFADGTSGLAAMRQQARDLGITMSDETAAKADRLGDAMASVKMAFNGVVLGIGSSLAPAITVVAEAFSTTIPKAFERASEAIRTATAWLAQHRPVLAGVAAAVAALIVPALWEWASAAWGAFAAQVALLAPLVATAAAIGAVVAAVVWLGQNWDAVFDRMPDGVQNALRAIKTFAEGFVSVMKTAINWLIDQLNKIEFTVPDWVPLLGGKKFDGLNIPKVEVMFGAIADVVGKTVSTVKGAVGSLGDMVGGLGKTANVVIPELGDLGGSLDSLGGAAKGAADTVKTMADVMEKIEADNLNRRIEAFFKGGEALAEVARLQNDQMFSDALKLADQLRKVFGLSLPDALERAMGQVMKSADDMAASVKKASDDMNQARASLFGNMAPGSQTEEDLRNAARAGLVLARDGSGNQGYYRPGQLPAGYSTLIDPGTIYGSRTPGAIVGPGGAYSPAPNITVNIQAMDGQSAADATVRALTQLESEGRISNVTVVG